MAEQKGGQVTHEPNLTLDDENIGDVKKSGDHGSWSDADGDLSIFEFDVYANESFPISLEKLDKDDDDDDVIIDLSESDYPSFVSVPGIFSILDAPGINGEQRREITDRLEYFPTSPFDVLYEDENVVRVASNNDSGGGYGTSHNNVIQDMLLLMASTPDHFVPTDDVSVGEATTDGQSLKQERDGVSDSENSTDRKKEKGD